MAHKSNRDRAKGRGAVLIIALLLISSAFLRLATGAGQAVAAALNAPDRSPSVQTEETPSTEQELENRKSNSLNRTEVGSLLASLRKREQRIETLETQIAMRRKALEVADEEIRKRLINLEQAEVNLRRTLALADGAAEDDLARLTTVYENMKPKDAAALFATMEPGFAAGFLGRMRPDAAAALMTGLPPDIAYSISVILAGRNASVPKS